MICAPSVGEEQADKSESVFTAFRYIYSKAQLKKGYLWCISQNTIIIIGVLYKRMRVIILIWLPFHIQNTTIDTEKDENKLW